MTAKSFIPICTIVADEYERERMDVIVVSRRAAALSHSFKVEECESDLENLGIVQFDLFPEFRKLLVLLLSTSWILLFAMVSKLVDLKRVIDVL